LLEKRVFNSPIKMSALLLIVYPPPKKGIDVGPGLLPFDALIDCELDAGISAEERSKVYFNENEFFSLIVQSNLDVKRCDLEPY